MLRRVAHIALLIAIAMTLFIACASNKPVVEEKPVQNIVVLPTIEFPSFQWDKSRFLYLDSSGFPDSIEFFVPVEDNFDIDKAVVIEDIHGWAENCVFDYVEFGHDGANVVIVEDISASMGDYVSFTDKLIWGYISILQDRPCEVSMVRFGDEVHRTLEWMLPSEALTTNPESLAYPNTRGSDLTGALSEALDLVAKRQSSPAIIVLFSDGDFTVESIPYHLVERATRYGVPINILLHGYSKPGALAEIAEKTGGIYLVQPPGGFSPGMVAAVLDRSYLVTYTPAHTDTNGILHKVVFQNPGNDIYRGEYRAPGELQLVEEPVPFVLPDKLLSTKSIPFHLPGNASLMPEAKMMLDAISAAVNSLPDTLDLELQIKGYACNIGPTGSNMLLSKKRANSVHEYLNERFNGNVSFDVSWFGEMYPLNSNSNETERRANRRVEITLHCYSCG